MYTLLLVVLFALGAFWLYRKARPEISASEAAQRVREGKAVLVDVREANEWRSGVAEPAQLLALSDLTGARTSWRPVLEANRTKEFIVYCGAGVRSGRAASILRSEGFAVVNLGGYSVWTSAGLPVRVP
ncbi:MAG: rhodanese-like domain-containing protein [Opitutaceae bacterium]|nr:rhodanese-like domain-containing protein [Opitutaceae bacterium]